MWLRVLPSSPTIQRALSRVIAATAAVLVLPMPSNAQWANRYPKIAGYSHHVYLEGYEMPTMASGPTGAAPAPDGSRIAFSARGWIWVLHLETGIASRVTHGAEMDFRPAWSPDGGMIAFVRDNDHDTRVVVMDVRTGAEIHTIDSPGIELDPVFTSDGSAVIYSSAESGTLDLWRYELASGVRTSVVSERELELRPQVAGDRILYLAKGGGLDRVMVRATSDSPPVELLSASIASMARPALGPDGRSVAVNWPTQAGWELRRLDMESPGRSILLVGGGMPLTPAWSADGEWIYYSEADSDEVVKLRRVRAVGGKPEDVLIHGWDWGEPTATVRIATEIDGRLAPARLNVRDGLGHPVVPNTDKAHFDGQSGRVFFYSPGSIEVTVPAGELTVSAVQGLSTPEVTRVVGVQSGRVTEVNVRLDPVWDARAAGWTSADHHFHLNYGGPYALDPEDLIPMLEGENLDVATPLIANLHDRFDSQELWGWQSPPGAPMIRFGQEIRSHFLGHIALIETRDLHWPWVWGPGYQVYGTDDRTNGEVLDFAHRQGGLGYYVHPVASPDPFSEAGRAAVPIELVVDAVLGDVDALEIVCLWSNPIGTAEVWHRFLSLGIPMVPSAGTDVMTNFYRTMAVGTARVYAQTGDDVNWSGYLAAYQAGRSFVTNGPMIEFEIGGAGPGEVLPSETALAGSVEWNLTLSTAVPVERVEVLVNGVVVWSGSGLEASGRRVYDGQLDLPQAGWVAVRAVGGPAGWPAMDMYPFAHTGATWIGAVGSTDPVARAKAAGELLEVLDVSEAGLIAGYGDVAIPKLRARFIEARARLESMR